MEGARTDAGFIIGEPYRLPDGTICERYVTPAGTSRIDMRLPLAEIVVVEASPTDQPQPGGDQ